MFVLAELQEDLHDLAANVLVGRKDMPTGSSKPAHAGIGDEEAPRMVERPHQSYANGSVGQHLSDLARMVRQKLPWRAAKTGEPVGMDVVGAGLLDEDHELFPIGTPYVVIAVDTWDAADAVRDAFEHEARLDEASWALDWSPSTSAFRTIRIFLSAAS